MTYEKILEEIEKAKTTNELVIYNTTITNEIWDKICELSNLELLDLRRCGLTNIPDYISNLTNIKSFFWDKNPINALIFRYTLTPLSIQDSDIIYGKIRNYLSEIPNLSIKMTNETYPNFVSLKNEQNYGLIFLSNDNFYLKKIDILVFGDKKNRKYILSEIREQIEKWIEFHSKNFSSISRFFNYPFSENSENMWQINFNTLLQYKESGKNIYPEYRYGIGIPIDDLIKYVGAEGKYVIKNWRGTNHITKVAIQNFKIFSELSINLSEGINIILGNNGLGKSSILQAITFGLLPIENNDYPNNVNEYITFNAERAEVKINWGENENRKIYIFSKGRPDEEEPVPVPTQLLLSYGVNLNTNIDQRHSGIIEALIKGENELHFTKSIFEDNYNKLFDPIIILEDLSREYDFQKNEEIKAIIHLYINTLNDFLSLIDGDEKISIQRGTIDYFYTDINKHKLKTKHLSEGYRDHILLISDILLRILAARKQIFTPEIQVTSTLFAQAKAVVIIDEFDRHLHPIWQHKLLSKFKEVLSNVQFILTTHNPFSVQAAVGANVIQLVSENGKVVAKNSTVQSKNILGIIRDYFTKEFFDFESQKLLKEFSIYMDKIDEGEVELVYNQDFKNLVQKIYDQGDELQSLIASQLLQLNSVLRKLNYKEFEL